MKILSELFKLKSVPYRHFFLFANNRTKDSDVETLLWSNPDFLSTQSICILFNTACVLDQYPVVQQHKSKWIFFRLLAMHEKYGTHFRDLDLLAKYKFDKFYFLPDMLDPVYQNKYFMKPTIDYLLSKNIDIGRLSHLNLIDNTEISLIKSTYPKNEDNIGTMSTGLWVYLYLKYTYPKSIITLVNYTMNISEDYHSANFEKGFLLSEIMSGRCNYIGSLTSGSVK